MQRHYRAWTEFDLLVSLRWRGKGLGTGLWGCCRKGFSSRWRWLGGCGKWVRMGLGSCGKLGISFVCSIIHSWIGEDDYLRSRCALLALSIHSEIGHFGVNFKMWMHDGCVAIWEASDLDLSLRASVLPPPCYALFLHRNSLAKASVYSECSILPERLEFLIPDCTCHLHFARCFAVSKI